MAKKKKRFKLKRVKQISTIYEQIVRVTPTVVDILKTDLEARDDDNILLIRYWQRMGIKDNTSFKKFKYRLIMGKIGLPESLMRSRRLMQSKHPSLRGKLYAARHKAEKEVRTQMKLFD